MPEIKFTDAEKSHITQQIQRYFSDQLNQDIGRFDAEFLLDFFADQVGAYFYNRGLHDAQALLAGKWEDLSDAFYQLQRPTEFQK